MTCSLVGRRFGRLTVQDALPARRRGMIVWACLCVCGKFRTVPTSALTSGNTTSCGCNRQAERSPLPREIAGARWISLTQGKFALVDDADYAAVSIHAWTFKGGYAARTEYTTQGPRFVLLHRVLLCAGEGVEVDHKNRDRLDCRRHNLRFADDHGTAQNRKTPRTNTSGYKGVQREGRKWRADIQAQGKKRYLGSFETREQAANAYDAAAARLHGAFAAPNRSTK